MSPQFAQGGPGVANIGGGPLGAGHSISSSSQHAY